MVTRIADRLVYLTREDWGADPSLARLGGPEAGRAFVPRGMRFYNIVHHTVGIDNDNTPNVWEGVAEVKTNMRFLQRVRPDLGSDVPYNFVLYLMADLSVIVCEGRGYDRSGAHTAGEDGISTYPFNYFNVSGIATSWAGNFEDLPIDVLRWLEPVQSWNLHLGRAFPNLAGLSVCGKETCGHKDYSRFSWMNATACPGQHLHRHLDRMNVRTPMTLQEEDDLATIVKVAGDHKTYLVRAGKPVHIPSKAVREELWKLYGMRELGIPITGVVVSKETFDFLDA